jgi:hypothetical protein
VLRQPGSNGDTAYPGADHQDGCHRYRSSLKCS